MKNVETYKKAAKKTYLVLYRTKVEGLEHVAGWFRQAIDARAALETFYQNVPIEKDIVYIGEFNSEFADEIIARVKDAPAMTNDELWAVR